MHASIRAGTPRRENVTLIDANVYLHDEQVEAIDELVAEGEYDSRSEAARVAVNHMLREKGKQP